MVNRGAVSEISAIFFPVERSITREGAETGHSRFTASGRREYSETSTSVPSGLSTLFATAFPERTETLPPTFMFLVTV